MASIKLDKTNEKTAWADLVEEEEKAPASAGAGTPQKEEKGWTEVNAPKKDKSKSRTKDSAPAGPVAKKLDFGDKNPSSNLKNNKFAALAWSDSE
jgi:hypothetical protein